MRMYPQRFPRTRAAMPERRAERRIYQGLANSGRTGFGYYEWRRGYGRIEVDFAVWIEGLGRFALQVKGGHYLLIDGEWHLRTRRGLKAVDASPLDEAWLGALDLHDDIKELAETAYNPFVTAALAFPDMEPDRDMMNLARRKAVHLLWGSEDPVQGLEEVSRKRGASAALHAARISREVLAVTDGLIRLNGAGDNPSAGETGSRHAGAPQPGPSVLSLSAGGLSIMRVSGRVNRGRLRSVIDRR